MHPFKVSNGCRAVAQSLVNRNEHTSIEDLKTAISLVEKLKFEVPPQLDEKGVNEWSNKWVQEPFESELTEKERDLLKASATRYSAKLPPDKYTGELLTVLGF